MKYAVQIEKSSAQLRHKRHFKRPKTSTTTTIKLNKKDQKELSGFTVPLYPVLKVSEQSKMTDNVWLVSPVKNVIAT